MRGGISPLAEVSPLTKVFPLAKVYPLAKFHPPPPLHSDKVVHSLVLKSLLNYEFFSLTELNQVYNCVLI